MQVSKFEISGFDDTEIVKPMIVYLMTKIYQEFCIIDRKHIFIEGDCDTIVQKSEGLGKLNGDNYNYYIKDTNEVIITINSGVDNEYDMIIDLLLALSDALAYDYAGFIDKDYYDNINDNTHIIKYLHGFMSCIFALKMCDKLLDYKDITDIITEKEYDFISNSLDEMLTFEFQDLDNIIRYSATYEDRIYYILSYMAYVYVNEYELRETIETVNKRELLDKIDILYEVMKKCFDKVLNKEQLSDKELSGLIKYYRTMDKEISPKVKIILADNSELKVVIKDSN